MKSLTAIAVVLCTSTLAGADTLTGEAVLRTEDLAVVDGSFNNVVVDVYDIVVSNPNLDPATAIGLSLPGTLVDGGSTVLDSTDLPTFGPFTISDCYFVSPTGAASDMLGVGVTDDATLLEGSYAIRGGGVFVPVGGSNILAVLSVPAGTDLDWSAFSGDASVGGVLEDIVFIPEPHAVTLLGLGGCALIRRRSARP